MQGSLEDLEEKILSLVDRISRAYDYILRKCSSKHGITTLQAELLLLAGKSNIGDRGVTKTSRMLLVTQPTVSDSISALARKGLIEVSQSDFDKRITRIKLSVKGEKIFRDLQTCIETFKEAIKIFDAESQEDLFKSFMMLTHSLYELGIVKEARMCLTCRHLSRDAETYYCSLLGVKMTLRELKIDCQDHEPGNALL
ncbi:MAG: MarR family winged helix-turn-helix transcriptional regulator [Desulfurococcales archaeon]|jgi:DNA-binding MarR family transcriptional regulator|nr:MarR family winged helix-turn-helix transcriptional regulator [Desulfurococcales archaeon]